MRQSLGCQSFLLLVSSVLCVHSALPREKGAPVAFDPAIVNDPNLSATMRVGPGERGPSVVRAQILLDRANFSPGEIDGNCGRNLRNAIAAFQKTRGVPENGVVGPETWQILNADSAPALLPYVISEQDVSGPFEKIPREMTQKAKLSALNYQSPLEALGEKFHCSPNLLRTLNPGKRFDRAGETIIAPNVAAAPPPPPTAILVSASDSSVSALDAEGKVVARFPASVGSEHDPLPVGTWKIPGVRRNPVFHYNPDLFWDADDQDRRAKIAAGPNNPVGVVWIALSKEHFGIHGAPEPSKIGYTQSHGCIRLTNWDAWKLADMVKPGMTAVLKE
jgi:lipoprotein-anchoring transpeptidase ErfK/SrfK